MKVTMRAMISAAADMWVNDRASGFRAVSGCHNQSMAGDESLDADPIDEWLAHSPTEEPEVSEPRRVDPFVVFGIVLGIVILIGMILLRPTGASQAQSDDLTALGIPTDFHRATVLDVTENPCVGLESLVCTVVRFEITEGPDESFIFVQEFPPSAAMPELAPGDRVVLSRVTPSGTCPHQVTRIE